MIGANAHKKAYFNGKKGIPLAVAISSANIHDIKAVTGIIDNSNIKRTFVSSKPKEEL